MTVATLRLLRDAHVVDLAREPRDVSSPLDREYLEWELRLERVLEIIGRELAKPVDPELSDVEYVPTEYVAELIQDAGYDGILYKSALGPGVNAVLFDPAIVRVGHRRVYRVTDVTWKSKRVTDDPEPDQ